MIRSAFRSMLPILLVLVLVPSAAGQTREESAPRGWLGVNLSSSGLPELIPVRDEIGTDAGEEKGAPSGALVVGVVRDSPADDAGLRSGDLVVQVDGVPVASATELIAAVQRHEPAHWAEFTLLRQGEERQVQVRLGERPEDVERAEVKEASAGVLLIAVPRQLREYWGGDEDQGVLLGAVDEVGPGWSAGLRPGDLVLRVNGHPVGRVSPLRRVFRLGGIGNTIELEVSRQGALFSTEVTLEELVPDDDAEDEQEN
jgi:serine protease Do